MKKKKRILLTGRQKECGKRQAKIRNKIIKKEAINNKKKTALYGE
jgi:hypothetical protein